MFFRKVFTLRQYPSEKLEPSKPTKLVESRKTSKSTKAFNSRSLNSLG